MDPQDARQALQDEERRLNTIRDDLRDAGELDLDELSQSGNELSGVDQHPADSASGQSQREIDLSMLEQIEYELSDVESALTKLDRGDYGKCEVCGKAIDAERLEALPATRYCAADAGARTGQAGHGTSPL